MNIYVTEANVNTNIEAIELAGNELLKEVKVLSGFISACTEREQSFPTALALPSGYAIAIPHGESKYVIEDSISFVRLISPVAFHLMDDPSKVMNCSLVFNLALSNGETHLQILRLLMKLFQNDEFIHECMTSDISLLPDYLKSQLLIND